MILEPRAPFILLLSLTSMHPRIHSLPPRLAAARARTSAFQSAGRREWPGRGRHRHCGHSHAIGQHQAIGGCQLPRRWQYVVLIEKGNLLNSNSRVLSLRKKSKRETG